MREVQRSTRVAWILGATTVVLTVAIVVRAVDGDVLARAGRTAVADPAGIAIAIGGFGAAFVVRSWAWTRVVPALALGQAWSGIHLSLAANHLLPMRLGEVVRPLSAARRTGLPVDGLVASTVALRAGDVLALAVVGFIAGPTVVADLLGAWAWAVLVLFAAVGVAAVIWLRQLRARGRVVRRPGAGIAVACLLAWVLESAVVHTAADWAGSPITWRAAMLVTAVAVTAQVAAIAPGGFGTYEAAATAALVAVGVPAATGLAIALVAHALKTAYSLGSGAVALWWPDPTLAGRLRIPRARPIREPAPMADGPVVLVLPAHDEEARVADVVRRLPAAVRGRPTRCIVVDDGSADGTAAAAARAGAMVIRHEHNRGLGAAVRTGLAAALGAGAAAVAFCDADGEYAPEELENLVGPIIDGCADYVVGSRFAGTIEHMRPHRRAGNLLLTAVLRFTARTPLTDGQSGYRALSREAAGAAEIVHDYNYAQVLTLDLLGKGFRYAEVPITYRFRQSGQSFVRLGRYLRKVVPAVWLELNPPATRLPAGAVRRRGGDSTDCSSTASASAASHVTAQSSTTWSWNEIRAASQ
jgi:uncharacterized membrane protein YbhN (UPF0104 family)